MLNYRRILVPVDGSPTSDKALAAALGIARSANGTVRLVHVLDEVAHLRGFESGTAILAAMTEGAGRVLGDAAEAARAFGVDASSKLVDKPGERLGKLIASEAVEWQADLVVVGTHGRRGFERMLVGSGAEQIIRLAPVPVLVIRGTEH